MAIHKLDLNDFQDADYSLYAIHADVEDYRLAHAINLRLKTRLKRLKDLDFSNSKNLFFSLFEWENSALKSQWNLIKNSCQIELESMILIMKYGIRNQYYIPGFRSTFQIISYDIFPCY